MTRILVDREIARLSTIFLSGDELHYLSRVRRHRPGDEVEIRSASGRCFAARIIHVSSESAELVVEQEISAELNMLPIRLLVSIPKRQLLDDVVRMVSELGIERLTPVIAERTVVRPKGDKLERWRRIAEESLRQCGRKRPLIIDDIALLASALSDAGQCRTKLLLHPDDAAPVFTEVSPIASPVTVAIGPEGGFTETEIASALSLGFQKVRLNTPILRIETAAVAAAVLSAAFLSCAPIQPDAE
jgi:16S rRNA (uracil1498-N3)-methyltransferase